MALFKSECQNVRNKTHFLPPATPTTLKEHCFLKFYDLYERERICVNRVQTVYSCCGDK